MGRKAKREIAKLRKHRRSAAVAQGWAMQRMAVDLGEREAEIERLRTTLATVRLFIEDEMIANAVVVLEGKDVRDPSNPSLLRLIDEALGDEQ